MGTYIYTDVEIDVKNPTESLFLKDALNQSVVTVLGGKVSTKENADSTVYLTLESVSTGAIDYDQNGYAILYRVTSTFDAKVKDKHNKKYKYSVSGNYDFAIESNSVLDEQTKQSATKQSFLRALDELSAKISEKGMEYDNQ